MRNCFCPPRSRGSRARSGPQSSMPLGIDIEMRLSLAARRSRGLAPPVRPPRPARDGACALHRRRPRLAEPELTPQGKPGLPGSRLRFNLAHSGEVALVAVTRDRDVGVDVERVRPDADRWALVDHALTARERHQLQRIAPTERAHAFLSMWARKEALLKAAGVGLAHRTGSHRTGGRLRGRRAAELGTAGDSTVKTVPLPSVTSPPWRCGAQERALSSTVVYSVDRGLCLFREQLSPVDGTATSR